MYPIKSGIVTPLVAISCSNGCPGCVSKSFGVVSSPSLTLLLVVVLALVLPLTRELGDVGVVADVDHGVRALQ